MEEEKVAASSVFEVRSLSSVKSLTPGADVQSFNATLETHTSWINSDFDFQAISWEQTRDLGQPGYQEVT